MRPSPRENRFGRFAWVLAGLCTLGALVQLVLWLLQQKSPISFLDWVNALGWRLAVPVLFSVLAALIIVRQPGNRVGWLMMLTALASVNPGSTILDRLPATPTTLTPGLWLLLWSNGWAWIPAIFPVFLLPLHFPTGRPPSPKWNWVNWLAVSMCLFLVILAALSDTIGYSGRGWTLPNPIGFIPQGNQDFFLTIWGLGLVTVVSASVASLFVRYRRAQVVERQQIKWLLYAGALFVVVYTVTFFLTVAKAETERVLGGWGSLTIVLSILALPIAIAIAILRYRLYDINVIIRKTLVYTVLSGLMVLVYFGTVVLLQSVFDSVSGQQSPIAIVISTLVIAALFAPLRRRVQAFIDRRFYRKKYDAQQVLAQFAQTARDETDMDALQAELLRVVQETLQPESVSLWLKPTNDRKRTAADGLRNKV